MRKIDPKSWSLFRWVPWTLFVTLMYSDRINFRALLRADFWAGLGIALLESTVGLALLAALVYCYSRFCRWFGEAIDRSRSRIAERIAARNGLVSWPASDPLHDPELDA